MTGDDFKMCDVLHDIGHIMITGKLMDMSLRRVQNPRFKASACYDSASNPKGTFTFDKT